jgi:predicted Rossmann fold flavoprotein
MKIYDVVVIGGGPAGMMAAGRAAERGKSVLLLEKNAGLGKKLLITGGGRCNVTNNKTEVREMLANYKKSDQFLFSAFAQFAVKDTIEFFTSRGVALKEENDGRMFPTSNSAQSIFDVLVDYLKKGGVEIMTGSAVTGISLDKKTGEVIISTAKEKITAKSSVLATGGYSRPETGSTGEGFKWLKKLGHTIIENDFALVPVALKDSWVTKCAGVSLKGTKLTIIQNGTKQESIIGNMLFTHVGISGPAVLNLSRDIGDALKYGEVEIVLDVFPKKDLGMVRKELQELLASESNKKIKNTLKKLVPTALAAVLLELTETDGETNCNMVSSESRKKLATLLKEIPLHVSHLLGANKAVVSSGGVILEEVDFKTMQSRKVPNLFLVGDTLNIDRPSGGYSLQLCWTTGFVAGDHSG